MGDVAALPDATRNSIVTTAKQQNAETLTVEQAMQQAVAHHQAGRLQEAEQLYRTILQAHPKQWA